MNKIAAEILKISKEFVGVANPAVRDHVKYMNDKDLEKLIIALKKDGHLEGWSPDDTEHDYRVNLAADICRLPPEVLKKHNLGE